MKKTQEYYQVIPVKVLEILPTVEPTLKQNIQGYQRDNLLEVISLVSCHIRRDNKPSQLQSTYVKKLVPQGDKYLRELINLRIVVRSGDAIIGKRSFQYSISPDYQSNYQTIVLKNAKLKRRIERVLNQKSKKSTSNNFSQRRTEQLKWLLTLTVCKGSQSFIEMTYSDSIDKFNCATSSVTRIMNHDFFGTTDDTSGRFHSNITNMAKGLRAFLRSNGQPLINIDVKNCQPFLSIVLLTNPKKVSFLATNHNFASLLENFEPSKSEDIDNYISLVVSGLLYEVLMDDLKKEGLELTRDQTKKQVLRILFSRNQLPKDETNRKARLIFRNRFPNVYRTFAIIRGSEDGDKFVNFKRFAILLQRIESYLILDVVMKRIFNELPGMPALTIHDSILTVHLEENIAKISKIMREELKAFVGFEPKLKIER